MDIHQALVRHSKIAKTQQLHRLGVSNSEIRKAVEEGTVIRLRKGWYGLHTIRPIERRALIDRGLLTCSSAAEVFGLPVEKSGHYHLRAPRPIAGVEKNCRRRRPTRVGATVGFTDLTEDYLRCQKPEWSLALVDALARESKLSADDWTDLTARLPNRLRKIVAARDARAESPLESILRFKLRATRVPFAIQVPCGRFRADFVVGHGLVVETHGAEFHAGKLEWERDRARVLWFRSQGWDVLEVTFAQVVEWTHLRDAIYKHIGRRLTQN